MRDKSLLYVLLFFFFFFCETFFKLNPRSLSLILMAKVQVSKKSEDWIKRWNLEMISDGEMKFTDGISGGIRYSEMGHRDGSWEVDLLQWWRVRDVRLFGIQRREKKIRRMSFESKSLLYLFCGVFFLFSFFLFFFVSLFLRQINWIWILD